jgi:hypothetical protein
VGGVGYRRQRRWLNWIRCFGVATESELDLDTFDERYVRADTPLWVLIFSSCDLTGI